MQTGTTFYSTQNMQRSSFNPGDIQTWIQRIITSLADLKTMRHVRPLVISIVQLVSVISQFAGVFLIIAGVFLLIGFGSWNAPTTICISALVMGFLLLLLGDKFRDWHEDDWKKELVGDN